jgi:hypothetical protein
LRGRTKTACSVTFPPRLNNYTCPIIKRQLQHNTFRSSAINDIVKKPIPLNDALKNFGKFVRTVAISYDAAAWNPNAFEYFFTREDLTVSLTGADGQKYQRCLSDLYEAVAPKEMLSRGAVENLANTAFAHILRKGMNVPREGVDFQTFCDCQLKELRKALERKPNIWEVISRVCGVDLGGLPLKIGKVDFVLATPDVLDKLPEAILTKNLTKEHFAGKALARISVPAVDNDAARAAANKVLQQTIDILNFFAGAAGVSGQAYVLGERERGAGLSVILGVDEQITHHSFLYGPVQPLPLSALVLQPGFGRISMMLAADNPDDLQNRILRAIQWAGRALVDPRREESFLLMAIALESLLLRNQKDENIGFKIALRCAHLIGLPQLPAKKLLVHAVKELYARRSAIVHSGIVTVSDSELAS